MLLAIDIGNSNVTLGVFQGQRLRMRAKASVQTRRSADEYAAMFYDLLRLHGIGREEIDGILCQLPLPDGIDEEAVLMAISPEKDVDGFHPLNVAALWMKQPCSLPCTPKGIIKLLKAAGVEIAGKRAVVVGRSNIVGLPVAKLLMDENATVTVAHSRTKDLAAVTRGAEILVVAIGRPKFVTADMVTNGTVVIDVGVNRNPETGKLCGDVDYAAVEPKASVITPVPGGVGPMTITCLMENTIECYLRTMEAR